MLDFVLESIRIVTMTLLLGYLLWIGSRNALHRQSGWGYFVTGFALVFVGSVFDITGNFPGLDDSAVIAGSAAQAFLDKFGGSLIGHSLILLGLLQWVPLISRVYRPGKLEL